MTLEQFLRNNRGIGVGGADLPRSMLEELYGAISREEIKLEQREFIGGAAAEGCAPRNVAGPAALAGGHLGRGESWPEAILPLA